MVRRETEHSLRFSASVSEAPLAERDAQKEKPMWLQSDVKFWLYLF